MANIDGRTDRLVGRAAGIANATLAVALGLTLVGLAWPRVERWLGMRPEAAPMAYQVGQTIDVPSGWYQSQPYTLVVFARASCSACQAAQPFLHQLVTDISAKSTVVLATPGLEHEDDLRYARQIGLADEQVRQVPTGLRVKATPTLVVVDRQGKVIAAWEGVGPPDQQTLIKTRIKTAIGN